MTVGEASRQYQIALEARRTLNGPQLVSFDEERVGADEDLAGAERALFSAWMIR